MDDFEDGSNVTQRFILHDSSVTDMHGESHWCVCLWYQGSGL